MHISPSNKVYIGITKRRCDLRWQHGRGYNQCPFMKHAVEKYGWDNFEHKIILENISKSEAAYTEKYLIAWYKSHNMSYNITNGGDGMRGVKKFGLDNKFYGKHHSDEAKERISNAQKKEKNNMYGTHAPIAIKVNGKYLTEYAKELGVPYTRFYLYYVRHNREINKTLEFYNNKLKIKQ